MSGYCGYSKSNRAVWAEQARKYSATRAAQIYGFKSAKAVATLMRPCEWHHTSKRYNITDYYNVESYIENLSTLQEINRVMKYLTKRGKPLVLQRAREIMEENLYDRKMSDFLRLMKARNAARYHKRKHSSKKEYENS